MTDTEIHNELLQVSIKHASITLSKNRTVFRGLTGSTRFDGTYKNFEFETKTKPDNEKIPKPTEKQAIRKMHGINKPKLKSKISAFFDLSMSKKFCAFYSVSFPVNFPDNSALSVLNNVLTSIRQNSLKFQYIWVAERQKNGTIHFHILINRFLNIRVTNRLFAKAIAHEMNVSNLHSLNYNPSTYNGCDVRNVTTRKHLDEYMTKYVSKNMDQFTCRAWASCQVVSAMFTSVSYYYGEVYIHDVHFWFDEKNDISKFDTDFFIYYPLKHPPPRNYMEPLINANNLIANDMKAKPSQKKHYTSEAWKDLSKKYEVIHKQLNFDFWSDTNKEQHKK